MPESSVPIARYEVRVTDAAPIVDEASFMRALPANAATVDEVALEVPVGGLAGSTVEVDFGGLAPSSHSWVGVRAVSACNVPGPIAVGEIETPAIQFTTVSPCFVATAAYGTPLGSEIGALRRFRDRFLLPTLPGRALVGAYEAVGPVLAGWLRRHEDARPLVRSALAPLVALAGALD